MPTNPAERRQRQSSSKRLKLTSARVPLPILAAVVALTAFVASGVTYALTSMLDSNHASQDVALAIVPGTPATSTTVPATRIADKLPVIASEIVEPTETNTPVPLATTEQTATPTLVPTAAPTIAEPTLAPTTLAPSTVPTGTVLPLPSNGKIAKPGVYSGSISNPSGDCIAVTADNVTITASKIGPCNGRGIYILGADNFQLLDSTVDNNRAGACCERYTTIFARNASNLTIRGSLLMRGESLIELMNVQNAVIEGNVGRDPKGPFPRGQFLQTQGSTSNVLFSGNVYTCAPSNGCKQEDAVNLFRGSNITIEGNQIDSGGGLGRSSGCGIITEGISTAVIRNNTLRNQYFGSAANPRGGCGIGIASGTNILVEGNNVSGYGNVAYYVRDFSSWSGGCSGVVVTGNVAGQAIDGDTNKFWDGGSANSGCSNVTEKGNSWQQD